MAAASPAYLTPGQEDWLFQDIERRGAFDRVAGFGEVSTRELWRVCPDLGMVPNICPLVGMRGRRTPPYEF